MTVVQNGTFSEVSTTGKLPERMICDQPLQHGRLEATA